MADAEQGQHDSDTEVDTSTPGYKPPAPKTLEEIQKQDAEDESLRKYKETLLGGATVGAAAFPADPRRVIVSRFAILVDGRPDIELNLQGDLKELKKKSVVLKEGCAYRVKIYFYVQRDIVTGLRFTQKSYKKVIQADKMSHMVGSYGPKLEEQSYTTPIEEIPSGLMVRGHYNNKSAFLDDDKNDYLKWEWGLEVKKDWE